MPHKKKDRSGKLKEYKRSQKVKNQKIVNMNNKQIVRKATWNADERFLISGQEFQALSDFANIVRPLVEMSNRILGQAELDEKIGFEYAYDDGSQIPQDVLDSLEKERLEKVAKKKAEIENYMKLLQEQKEKLAKQLETIEEQTPPKMEVMK